MKRKIGWGLLITLIVIQFVPYSIRNAEYDPADEFFAHNSAPTEIKSLIQAACYDCHSQQAKTPWYGHIAPLKFWLNKHVRGGRMNLDFNDWANYDSDEQSHKLKEIIEEIESGEMPLNSYTWMHEEAVLSNEQRALLVAFFDEVD